MHCTCLIFLLLEKKNYNQASKHMKLAVNDSNTTYLYGIEQNNYDMPKGIFPQTLLLLRSGKCYSHVMCTNSIILFIRDHAKSICTIHITKVSCI